MATPHDTRFGTDPEAVTQNLPVVTGSGASYGSDLEWASDPYKIPKRTSTPVTRTRLVVVYSLLAVTALAATVTLSRGGHRAAAPPPPIDDSLLIAPVGPADDFPDLVTPPPPPSLTGAAMPKPQPTMTTTSAAVPSPRATRKPAAPASRPVPTATRTRPPAQGAGGNGPWTFGPVLGTYEAEDERNTLHGRAVVVETGLASGGRAVGRLGRAPDSGATGGTGGPGVPEAGSLRLNDLDIPTTGRYAVTIFYTTSGVDGQQPLAATVRVNGVAAEVAVPFARADGIATKILLMNLRSGLNAIELGNPAGPAPTVDRVTLRAVLTS